MHVLVYTADEQVMRHLVASVQPLLSAADAVTYIHSFNAFVSYVEDWGHSVDLLITEPDVASFDSAEMLEYISSSYPGIHLAYVNSGKPVIMANYCIPHLAILAVPVELPLLKGVLERCRQSSSNMRCAGLYLQDRNVATMIPFNRIFHIESQVRSSRLYTLDGELNINENLSSIEKRLDGRFIRCHQSFIVNVAYVRMYICDPEDTNYACLELFNGERIPVSVRKQKYTRDFFESYCRGLEAENGKYIVKLN